MKLDGRRALITGGNSGIGLATAQLFVEEGARVAITGRNRATLDAALTLLGNGARAYQADFTEAHARKKCFESLAVDFGQFDVVFVNAGISGRAATGSADEAVFENVIRTNVLGSFFTVNALSSMLSDGGSIIFNGSAVTYTGQVQQAAYAASKGAILAMARSIAADLAPRRIRVNVVSPGPIKTPIWARVPSAATAEEKGQAAAFISSLVPLGRWGEASEVAKAVLFLASDASSYITSTELLVDGGLTGSPLGSARTLLP